MFEHFDLLNMVVLVIYFVIAYLTYALLGMMQISKSGRLTVPKDAMVSAAILWPITLVVWVVSTIITKSKEFLGVTE